MSGAGSVRLVLLMPVYEDRASARALLVDVALAIGDAAPHCILLEDGSRRDPMRASDLEEAGLGGEILHLSRNMGHQRAIATGIAYAAHEYPMANAVVMDADGEDRPEAIPAMITAMRSGDYDAVVAERRQRTEGAAFRLCYRIYRFLFHIVTGRTIRFGNFSLLSAEATRRLAVMPEVWLHVASAIMVSRLRVASVAVDRGTRYAGRSRMGFLSLTLHGLRSMMVFAEDVMVRVVIACLLLAAGAGTLLATSAGLKLFGIATPGWYSTASGILIVIFLQACVLTFLMLMVAGTTGRGPPVASVTLALLIGRIERAGTPNGTTSVPGAGPTR